MNIKAYLKPHCGWSDGIRAILRKYGLPFEDCDVFHNPDLYAEMVRKSGQPLSPCVEIDGVMLADVSGEEVENYLLAHALAPAAPATAALHRNSGAVAAVAPPPDSEKPIRFF
jgi:monothiol glutaredoxin